MSGMKNGGERREADLLSARQVAAKLGVGVRSIWRWADEGRMPQPLLLGRLKKWRASDIDAWIERGCPLMGRR